MVWRTLPLGIVVTIIALAPPQSRAQDYAPPDPVFPLPAFHERPTGGGFYIPGGPSGGPLIIPRTVVDQAIEAMGGETKLAELHCGAWKGNGTIKIDDEKWTFKHSGIWEGLNRLRLQTERIEDGESKKAEIGVKDGRYWVKGLDTDDLGDVHCFMECWYALQLPNLMPSFNDPAFKISSVPPIQIDGQPAEGIRVVRNGFHDVLMYFDKASHLPKKLDLWTNEDDGDKIHFEFFLSKYKEFHGIQQPRRSDFNSRRRMGTRLKGNWS